MKMNLQDLNIMTNMFSQYQHEETCGHLWWTPFYGIEAQTLLYTVVRLTLTLYMEILSALESRSKASCTWILVGYWGWWTWLHRVLMLQRAPIKEVCSKLRTDRWCNAAPQREITAISEWLFLGELPKGRVLSFIPKSFKSLGWTRMCQQGKMSPT